MIAEPSAWVELGRLGRPKGLRGWLRVDSWTDPAEALLDYPLWTLRGPAGDRVEQEVAEAQHSTQGLWVRLQGVESRESAALWVGRTIEVPRASLPALAPGEHYRHDLIGCRVVNLEGVDFGVVERFEDLPANAVMVVRGESERWLPVSKQHLVNIDASGRRIEVDWPEEL